MIIKLVFYCLLLVLMLPQSKSQQNDATATPLPSNSSPFAILAPTDTRITTNPTVLENTDDDARIILADHESFQPIAPAATSPAETLPADATMSQTRRSPSRALLTPKEAQTTPKTSKSPPPPKLSKSPMTPKLHKSPMTPKPSKSPTTPTMSPTTPKPHKLPTPPIEVPTKQKTSKPRISPTDAPISSTNAPISSTPTDTPASQTDALTSHAYLSDSPSDAPSITPTSAPSLLVIEKILTSPIGETKHLAYTSAKLNLLSVASKMNTKYAAMFSSYLEQCLLTYLPSFQASESSSQYSLSQVYVTIKKQDFSSGARRRLSTNSTSNLGLLTVSLKVKAEYSLLDEFPILFGSDPMAPSNADFAATLIKFFDDDNGGTIFIHDYLKGNSSGSYFENLYRVERYDPDRTGGSSEVPADSIQNPSNGADNISAREKSRTVALICMVGAFGLVLFALFVITRTLKEKKRINGKWKGSNNAGFIDKKLVNTLERQNQDITLNIFVSSQHSVSSIHSGSFDVSTISGSSVHDAPSEDDCVAGTSNPTQHLRAPISARTSMPSILGYLPAGFVQTFAGPHSDKTIINDSASSDDYHVNGSFEGLKVVKSESRLC